MSDPGQWRRCSACKNPIDHGATYWTCNVSTCNRKRTGMVFCTVSCWEVHLPTANHREAWAVEERAPSSSGNAAQPTAAAPPERARKRIIASSAPPAAETTASEEVLIVGSRLKAYVRERSGMNTSDRVLDPLSAIVRRVCDVAIRNAERDGRKTVLDRDIPAEIPGGGR